MSAYGGVIGINRTVDEETAREMAKTFLEAIAAPDYSAEALQLLTAKKNLRLMRVAAGTDPLVVKSISGGYLAQTADLAKLDRAQAVVKTKRAPTEQEWVALEFGWKVAKHVKSNAIVYARARPDGGCRCGPDEPRRFGEIRRYESGAAGGWLGGGVGRLFPVRGRRGGSSEERRHGVHSAGRIDAR